MAMLKLYKSRIPNIAYIFKDGQVAPFKRRTNENAGHYLTKDEDRIKELDKVCVNHQHLYIDPNDFEIDEADADPAVAYRNKVREEIKAELLAGLGDPNQQRAAVDSEINAVNQQEFGDTGIKPTLGGIGNSSSMAATSPDSNGAATGTTDTKAALADLVAKKV